MNVNKRLVFVIPLRFLGANGYMEVLCPPHRKVPNPGVKEPPAGELYAHADTPSRAIEGRGYPQS